MTAHRFIELLTELGYRHQPTTEFPRWSGDMHESMWLRKSDGSFAFVSQAFPGSHTHPGNMELHRQVMLQSESDRNRDMWNAMPEWSQVDETVSKVLRSCC